MKKKRIKINSFLTERKDRFKPGEANSLGLRRVNKIDFFGKIHLTDHRHTRTNMILVKKGDLLMSGINAEKGSITVYELEEDAIATIHYSSYIYNKELINIEYLKWFLKSNIFKNILISQSGSGIKSELKANQFLNLEIDLPSMEDQLLIINQIFKTNQEIQKLNSLINENKNLLFKLQESILQESIRGKLTEDWRQQNLSYNSANQLLVDIQAEKKKLIEDGKIKKEKSLPLIKKEEITFDIPKSWVYTRLGEIINLKSGQDLKANQYSDFESSGIPYITGASNLEKEKLIINRWTNTPKSFAYQGDLLITCKGSGVGKMGWMNVEKAHIARQLMAIRGVICSQEFVKHILDANIYIIKHKANGVIPGIDRKTILEIIIGVPPIEEQKIIVKKVTKLNMLCLELENAIRECEIGSKHLLEVVLSELLEEETDYLKTEKAVTTNNLIRKIKYDSNTILMELVDLLKKHGRLHAEDLWKMSKFPDDIDKFYAELKHQIENQKAIKESTEKGYLELQ